MRYGIISDIHGNLEALERVLEELKGIDEVICLGDIVGYGANPNECCELVRENCGIVLMGNHDAAAIGMMDLMWFNQSAREAIVWVRQHLTDVNRKFLETLSAVKTVDRRFVAVHGSLREPIEEYILNEGVAYGTFQIMQPDVKIVFCGHTHIAEAYEWSPGSKVKREGFRSGGIIYLSDQASYIINCGSVGQPRDYNRMASFGIYDAEAKMVTINRVEYDIDKAARKIIEAGLPPMLATRLYYGV